MDSLSLQAKNLIKSWKKYRDDKHIKERPSWHTTFLNVALEVSKRSHDAQSKFGCVIINQSNEIVSTGYNGFIRNIDDGILPNLRPAKYDYFLHAEHQSVLNCARQGKSTLNTIAYVTGMPCLNCLQILWQTGISKIYYANIHKANMIITDENYKEKLEVFKYLTSHGLEIIELKI